MTGPGRQMMAGRWREVDRLFDRALDLPEEERQAFLVEACDGDGALLEAVSGLLESSTRDPKPLTGPGADLLRAAFDDPQATSTPGLTEGTLLGHYRVLREVGRGGMAMVYEAERADGAFEHRVAIKVLRGLELEGVTSHFLAERQILSSLNHPNIAGLLDGGTADDGRPYLVMELVDGSPITTWADRARLTVEERVDLFMQVVDAVQYAHTHLVVHRDIKPSNVQVDGEGRVRLLDFGIAKLLDASAEAAPQTRPATRWMTPEYASPEQVQGHPVTTATDVYALGALLYELLTGHRPVGAEGSSDYEVQRAITEEVPPLASTKVGAAAAEREGSGTGAGEIALRRSTTPQLLRRRLAGDLDAVLSKALRKRPQDRYLSAQALNDDLRRHRTGFPVRAHEGMWAYRARKFVGRHRLPVAAAALVGLVLTGSSVLLARSRAQAERARDLATQEAENARLVIDFLADVFRGRDPNQAPSDTFTARELLRWGTERVSTEFADRPAIRAELSLVLGGAYYNLGLLDEGAALLERAVGLRREAFGPESAQAAEALFRLAEMHRLNRDLQKAIPLYGEAARILRVHEEEEEERLATVLGGLGLALRDEEQADSAEALLREALAIRRRHSQNQKDLSATLLSLAYVRRAQGALDEAEALYTEGIANYRTLPDREEGELATYLNNLAYLHRVREDYAGAEPLYREAVAIYTKIYGRGHPATLNGALNLAGVLELQGRNEEALLIWEESARAAEEQWPEGHWRVGSAYNNWGSALLRTGRAEEAVAPLRIAVDIYTRELGAQHDWTSFADAKIALVDILVRDGVEGRAFLDRLHAWLQKQKDERGGTIDPAAADQLNPFVFLLGQTGPEEEYRRFAALLAPAEPAESDGGR